MSAFEDRLWRYLADEHAADELASLRAEADLRPRASFVADRRWPLAMTASAVVAIVAAAIVLLVSATTSTQPAYALTRNPDGSITVTFHDLQTAIPQLNARFAAMGVDEKVVPIKPGCQTEMGMPVFPQSASKDTLTFTPNEGRKWLAPGFDGVLAAGYSPTGQLLVFIGAMKPPLPTCFPPTAAVIKSNSGS